MLRQALPAERCWSCSWWDRWLAEVIEMVKVNQLARLSAARHHGVMPVSCMVASAGAIGKTSRHLRCWSRGVLDALEYAIAARLSVDRQIAGGRCGWSSGDSGGSERGREDSESGDGRLVMADLKMNCRFEGTGQRSHCRRCCRS